MVQAAVAVPVLVALVVLVDRAADTAAALVVVAAEAEDLVAAASVAANLSLD